MDFGLVLHMKEGLGEASYAQNSSLQKTAMEALKHIVVESAVDCYSCKSPQTLNLADLGCASGLNSLCLAGDIIEAIHKRCREVGRSPPEFMVFLNDLPANDFNTVFASVPEFVRKLKSRRGGGPLVFTAGVPGSFYGRLFPSSSLHFVTSCYSLHWLSQVPPGLFDEKGKPTNRGKIYISSRSPPSVAATYYKQFQKDFGTFLESRSEEIVPDGRMVLAMLGRKAQDHFEKTTTILWELLAQAFAIMVSQELVEEEAVDSYNVPFYAPSLKEVEEEVHKEGSFTIDHIEVRELNISTGDAQKDGKITAMAIRAIQEPMISHHFGEGVIETLFRNYSGLLCHAMGKEEIKGSYLIVVLRKLQ